MAKEIVAPSGMLPGMMDELGRGKYLDSIVVSVEGRMIYASRLPSRAERTQLQTWNADLTRRLRPASMAVAEMEEARRHLSALFLGYGSMRYEGEGVKDIVDAYMLVLQKYPLFAIVEAVADVAGNRVPGLNVDRPPTSPRMGKIAADHIAKIGAQQLKIDRLLQAKAVMVSDKTAADKARVAASLKDFHGRMTPTEGVGVLTPEERKVIDQRKIKATDQMIIREYERLGLEVRYWGGRPMSLSLAKSTGAIDTLETSQLERE